MVQKYRSSDVLVHFFFLVCIAALVGGFLFMLKEIRGVKNQKAEPGKETTVKESQKPLPTPETIVGKKTNAKEAVATAKPEKRITYLNLNGASTIQSTDWTDIKSTDAWINLEGEYGAAAYVDWEAAIKTSSSGSKVFVRLYDATHNIAVNGSELESNSTVSVRVASGRLYFWRGQNIYRVQIKSLNGLDATFDGGRIKIVY